MNVFYLGRTVSGLFDVPLDDPKQQFSQKMRFKKSEFPAKGPKKAFRASSAPVDFKEVAMVDGAGRKACPVDGECDVPPTGACAYKRQVSLVLN